MGSAMDGGEERGRGRTLRTETDVGLDGDLSGSVEPEPALLLAWAPREVVCADRARVPGVLRVGRSRGVEWSIPDRRLSGEHFEVVVRGDEVVIRDLGSTNGTFVNGVRLGGARVLGDQDVVRAGRCVFAFQGDAREVAEAAGVDAGRYGFAGRFHSPAIVGRLEQAVRTRRHLLIEGESGVGKELAARCAHRLGRPAGPFVAHNCARFATAEEAETTIFGVARGVFSGVEARAGLLEEAEGGTLYLDEVPNLPVRVQRSLLRFAEDGVLARIGESRGRTVDVWLLLGTNRPVEGVEGDGTVAADLAARTHRVRVPPLRSRRADVPGIFVECLGRACGRAGVDAGAVRELLGADHFEALALAEARDGNVRFLEDVAAEVAARVGVLPAEGRRAALTGVFARRLAGSPVLERFRRRGEDEAVEGKSGSPYERHREEIVAAYREMGGNLSAVEEAFRRRGVELHRRWIAVFLERWGVRTRKRRIPVGPAGGGS